MKSLHVQIALRMCHTQDIFQQAQHRALNRILATFGDLAIGFSEPPLIIGGIPHGVPDTSKLT
jgi:hypothetical protein